MVATRARNSIGHDGEWTFADRLKDALLTKFQSGGNMFAVWITFLGTQLASKLAKVEYCLFFVEKGGKLLILIKTPKF